jgi:hypothetical protein
MGMATNPRLRARGSDFHAASDAGTRVLVFAPEHETWIKSELAGTRLIMEIAPSVKRVVEALTDQSGPRPQILIVDFNSMSAGELLYLHSIREQGWFGNIVALGRIPASLRKSMNIERSVDIGPYKLRPIAALAGQHAMHTIRMPKLGT